ncbi:MAG: hypothetical protein NTZ35_01490 [Ignavibacteriales bacterium]|nr:hypothetical protein [Ignavibacteriales bacterium]
MPRLSNTIEKRMNSLSTGSLTEHSKLILLWNCIESQTSESIVENPNLQSFFLADFQSRNIKSISLKRVVKECLDKLQFAVDLILQSELYEGGFKDLVYDFTKMIVHDTPRSRSTYLKMLRKISHREEMTNDFMKCVKKSGTALLQSLKHPLPPPGDTIVALGGQEVFNDWVKKILEDYEKYKEPIKTNNEYLKRLITDHFTNTRASLQESHDLLKGLFDKCRGKKKQEALLNAIADVFVYYGHEDAAFEAYLGFSDVKEKTKHLNLRRRFHKDRIRKISSRKPSKSLQEYRMKKEFERSVDDQSINHL